MVSNRNLQTSRGKTTIFRGENVNFREGTISRGFLDAPWYRENCLDNIWPGRFLKGEGLAICHFTGKSQGWDTSEISRIDTKNGVAYIISFQIILGINSSKFRRGTFYARSFGRLTRLPVMLSRQSKPFKKQIIELSRQLLFCLGFHSFHSHHRVFSRIQAPVLRDYQLPLSPNKALFPGGSTLKFP